MDITDTYEQSGNFRGAFTKAAGKAARKEAGKAARRAGRAAKKIATQASKRTNDTVRKNPFLAFFIGWIIVIVIVACYVLLTDLKFSLQKNAPFRNVFICFFIVLFLYSLKQNGRKLVLCDVKKSC